MIALFSVDDIVVNVVVVVVDVVVVGVFVVVAGELGQLYKRLICLTSIADMTLPPSCFFGSFFHVIVGPFRFENAHLRRIENK